MKKIDRKFCLEWPKRITISGYGRVTFGGKNYSAHRLIYELFFKPVAKHMVMDHLCRNRRCVNPYHLEPVLHKVNILRGNAATSINAKKTHCHRGHKFNKKNTRFVGRDGDKKNGRSCRVCERFRYHEKQKDPKQKEYQKLRWRLRSRKIYALKKKKSNHIA